MRHKMNPILFPSMFIFLNILSCIVYATNGDWRKAIYWASAAVLTASVTF